MSNRSRGPAGIPANQPKYAALQKSAPAHAWLFKRRGSNGTVYPTMPARRRQTGSERVLERAVSAFDTGSREQLRR